MERIAAMKINSGTVIFRHWNQQEGLSEIAKSFRSLEELFGLCLQKEEHLLVDRIIIDGQDDADTERTVTLVFQSVTVHDKANDKAKKV